MRPRWNYIANAKNIEMVIKDNSKNEEFNAIEYFYQKSFVPPDVHFGNLSNL